MILLGIESSCDETAAAVVSASRGVLSSVIASQIADHQPFGGVVPELAAREHVQALPSVLERSVAEARIDWPDIDGIAVTQGPGLSSSLLCGLSAAWGLSRRLNLPLYPVHHLEGHILSLFLDEAFADMGSACPSLVLLVTGGHTALIRMESPGDYHLLGRSIDDAAGEALDKGARLMGLPYPGGPEIEKLAKDSMDEIEPFPRGYPNSEEARKRGGAYPFSFSGLKTALLRRVESDASVKPADLAKAYQSAVMDTLVQRVAQALTAEEGIRSLGCVGGVANNQLLRTELTRLADQRGIEMRTVSGPYCTDNAAMIAGIPLCRDVTAAESFPAADPNLSLQGLQLR